MTRPLRPIILSTVALAILVVVVTGCGGGGGGDTGGGGSATSAEPGDMTMSLGIQQEWTSLPVYVALEQGFFEDHGISEVEIVKFTALPAMFAAVSQTQIDAALQTPPSVVAYNEESDSELKFFAPGQGSALTWVAGKDSGIPSAKSGNWEATVRAFKGKKIGVAALGGITDLMTRYMAAQVGLDPEKDLDIVAIGVGAPEVAALEHGAVDVTTGDNFGATSVVQSGAGEPVLNLLEGQGPEEFLNILIAGYLASANQLAGQPQLYEAFNAAYREALEFMKDPANQAAVEETITGRIGAEKQLAEALYPTIDSFQIGLTPAVMEKTLKAFTASGLVAKPGPSSSELIWQQPGQ